MASRFGERIIALVLIKVERAEDLDGEPLKLE